MSKTSISIEEILKKLAKRSVEQTGVIFESFHYDNKAIIDALTAIHQLIEREKRLEAITRKAEIEAKKQGFYMAAGLFGVDSPDKVEPLWEKCAVELNKQLEEL